MLELLLLLVLGPVTRGIDLNILGFSKEVLMQYKGAPDSYMLNLLGDLPPTYRTEEGNRKSLYYISIRCSVLGKHATYTRLDFVDGKLTGVARHKNRMQWHKLPQMPRAAKPRVIKQVPLLQKITGQQWNS